MSADNRICILPLDGGYYVFEGSASANYFEAPNGAYFTLDINDARTKAAQIADTCCILEYGIEEIDNEEIQRGLRDELEYARVVNSRFVNCLRPFKLMYKKDEYNWNKITIFCQRVYELLNSLGG